MKHFTLFLRKGFTSALTLALAMIVLGGGSALADTVIFDSSTGNDIAGWAKSGINLYHSTPKVLYTNSTGTLTSNEKITLLSGDRFIIEAKGRYSGNAGITVKYSADGSDWTTAKEFSTTTSTFPTNSQDFAELVVDNIVGAYYIQLDCVNMSINLIKIANAPTTPTLSVTAQDGGVFGYVTANTTKTFTVKNIGSGSMDVNISSNDASFIVSESSLTGITNDGVGKTFDVTYIYSDNKPHFADITVTPTFEGAASQVINVSAGPEVVIDENTETTWTTGSEKNVYVNYTAVNGWNTICLPIAPNSYKTQLFGSGATVLAYAFKSFANNTLTLEKANYMGANTPYVVYVDNAASEEFVLTGIYVGYASAGKTTNNGVTFQGTYAPKAAGTLTGNYGVTSDGRIVKAGIGASIKGYRAYFTGVPTGSGIKGFVIDGEDATDIGLVQMVEGSDKPVYNMSGQKVQKAQRGIYIINGKKVVIK